MKNFLFSMCLLMTMITVYPQVNYTDVLIEYSVYSFAPEEIQQTKPFIRERWFFEQRAYPNNFIPENAYANALEQRNLLRQQNSENMPNINWVSLGPTPGYYFSYGTVYD